MIHATAILGEGVRIGEGTHVGPYAVIEAATVIGKSPKLARSSTASTADSTR